MPFHRIILRYGMRFHRLPCGKSKLTADYTAERNAFPQDNSRKVKILRGLSYGKFQRTGESQSLTFERPIFTSKANLRQKFNQE
jgi:hypothetical protein